MMSLSSSAPHSRSSPSCRREFTSNSAALLRLVRSLEPGGHLFMGALYRDWGQQELGGGTWWLEELPPPFHHSELWVERTGLRPATSGAGAQEFQLLQPQGAVSVSAGETLTLNCSVTGLQPVGPMKWFKGSGSGRQLVYAQVGSFPRVTRAVNGSDTNYNIHISDTRPEDAGIYHCVKFRKGSGADEEVTSGNGTVVSVSARPSAPSVSGPPSRAEPGPPVNFTCTSGGFSPRDIAVTWLKNGAKLPAPQPRVLLAHESVSYNMSSTVGVSLTAGDARSQLTCQIAHSTLPAPLRATYNLSDALRVPPRLRVGTDPAAPVALNKSVTFTCHAEGFYPKDASLTWLENGNEMDLGKPSSLTENPDGTYTLQSSLEVNATEQRNQSVFTCRVVHDSQPPFSDSAMLRLSQPSPEPDKDPTSSTAEKKIYLAVAVVCAVLVVLVIAVIYLIRVRQRKGKSSPSVRLHEPEKSPSTAPQDSDANNLTYADLNFDKQKKKSKHRFVEMSPQSEYACIQTGQPAATEDNLTYADLDMVHLSKAPKRPAPRPEEAISEYASVQIQRK
ncbi:tyrosine-protein phosphatase non-receptor type substrate 1-like isoform X2 [Trachemys scripta elegans]|uniref:tyrosine-protein phosphatase non-receptor type substrate 1-like isoform X2 n=1 Tax=Trachemys scripta elegans TaxID=31138 RepID=UPI001554E499|nr:tyrosine-protein phosphatase non-receptor type substrate 1-like isoform X2 [Trachemys scripta elegans]